MLSVRALWLDEETEMVCARLADGRIGTLCSLEQWSLGPTGTLERKFWKTGVKIYGKVEVIFNAHVRGENGSNMPVEYEWVHSPLLKAPAKVKEIRIRRLEDYVPQGSTGEWAGSGGRCVSCERTFTSDKLIRRMPTIETGVAFGNPRYGYKVCIFCSPELPDEKVYLHTRPMKEWTTPQKMGLSS